MYKVGQIKAFVIPEEVNEVFVVDAFIGIVPEEGETMAEAIASFAESQSKVLEALRNVIKTTTHARYVWFQHEAGTDKDPVGGPNPLIENQDRIGLG